MAPRDRARVSGAMARSTNLDRVSTRSWARGEVPSSKAELGKDRGLLTINCNEGPDTGEGARTKEGVGKGRVGGDRESIWRYQAAG